MKATQSKLFALLLAVALSGCIVGDRLGASRADYAAYRQTRVAPNVETRLAASGRYLREHPDGRFRPEVRVWFEAAEPRFFADAHDRPSLLRAYLRALPRGPHAQAARDRLEEFTLLNEYRGKREAASERFVTRVERELEVAQSERERFITRVTSLIALMAKTRTFGQPTAELDHSLIYGFRLEPPVGHCAADACTKRFELAYSVPTRAGLVLRSARFELGIDLDSGLVKRLWLAGPELFSRVTEAVDRVYLDPQNLLGRTEAIARALQLFENTLEATLPSGECRRDVVAPVVLSRVCRGVSLSIVVGTEPGERDRIEVSPAKP